MADPARIAEYLDDDGKSAVLAAAADKHFCIRPQRRSALEVCERLSKDRGSPLFMKYEADAVNGLRFQLNELGRQVALALGARRSDV